MTAIEARAIVKAREELVRAAKELERLQNQEIKQRYCYRGCTYTK